MKNIYKPKSSQKNINWWYIMPIGWLIGGSFIYFMWTTQEKNIKNEVIITCEKELNVKVEKAKNNGGWLVLNGRFYSGMFDYSSSLKLLESKEMLKLHDVEEPYEVKKLAENDTIWIIKDSKRYYYILDCDYPLPNRDK